MKREEIIKYCDSIIHSNTFALSKPRLYEKIIESYWIKRDKNYGTVLIVTSDIDNTYDNIHKAIVTYMDMDIMNIRKTNVEIVMDCLIGNQEKIMIIIKKDYNIGMSVRGMRADLVILDAVDDVINIKEDNDIKSLIGTTSMNQSDSIDRLIMIYDR